MSTQVSAEASRRARRSAALVVRGSKGGVYVDFWDSLAPVLVRASVVEVSGKWKVKVFGVVVVVKVVEEVVG